MRYLMLTLLLIAAAGHAEDRTITTDGSWWNALTPNEKVMFLQGYGSGYNEGQSELSAALRKEKYIVSAGVVKEARTDAPVEITFGTLMKGVDECYSDYRNSKVDVAACILWTVDGVNGVDENVRTYFLAEMRKMSK
jgi:hypothetical protein